MFAKVFALFNEKKPEIYALYRDPIGKLLDDDTVRETLKYFDEFYETINDPRSAKRQIIQAEVIASAEPSASSIWLFFPTLKIISWIRWRSGDGHQLPSVGTQLV